MSIQFMMNQTDMSNDTPSMAEVWTSLYVANIPQDVINVQNEEDRLRFQMYIESVLQIGKVKRIDYVVKDGRGSAFIHFDYWHDSFSNQKFRNEIDTQGVCKIAGIIGLDGYENYFCPRKHRYLSFKQNKNVLVEKKDALESMNVLQLAQLVRELDTENAKLKEELANIREEFGDDEQLLLLKHRKHY